jgi:cysteine synthase
LLPQVGISSGATAAAAMRLAKRFFG